MSLFAAVGRFTGRASLLPAAVCACLTGATPGALADPPAAGAAPPAAPTTRAADTQVPWKISLGYLADQTKGGHSHGYYLLKYNDDVITTGGTAISVAEPASQESVFKDAPNDAAPHLSLNNGLVSGSGGVFQGVFRRPIGIPALRAFLGTVDVDTTTDLKNIRYHGGLEAPRLPVFDGLNKALFRGHGNTWTYVGVFDETVAQSAGTTTNKDAGLLTYRSFLGAPLSWTVKKPNVSTQEDVGLYDKHLSEQMTQRGLDAPAALNAWYDDLQKNRRDIAQHGDEVENAVLTLGGQHPETLDHPADFRNLIVNYFAQAPAAKQVAVPITALWCESKGWFRFTNQSGGGARFTNLLTLNAQYFINPKSSDGNWVKVSYEVGTDRAAPTVFNRFVAVTTGFSF